MFITNQFNPRAQRRKRPSGDYLPHPWTQREVRHARP